MLEKDKISDDLEDFFLGTFYIEVNEPWKSQAILESFGPARTEIIKKELRAVIDKKLWSKTFYEGLIAVEFETEASFYAYLEEIWQYVFNDGPLPDGEKYWY